MPKLIDAAWKRLKGSQQTAIEYVAPSPHADGDETVLCFVKPNDDGYYGVYDDNGLCETEGRGASFETVEAAQKWAEKNIEHMVPIDSQTEEV